MQSIEGEKEVLNVVAGPSGVGAVLDATSGKGEPAERSAGSVALIFVRDHRAPGIDDETVPI